MAKTRMLNTTFWRDDFVSNLDPLEKYLYLYLLSNPDTTICGIYQIPLKIIAADTGLDSEMVLKMFNKFELQKKIKYSNGWIAIKNFVKNQKQGSDRVLTGIKNELKKAPKDLILWVFDVKEPIDSLSHLNLNLNLNSNSNLEIDLDEIIDVENKNDIQPESKRIDTLKRLMKDKFFLTGNHYSENENTDSKIIKAFKLGLTDEEILKCLDNYFKYDYFCNKDGYFLNNFLGNISRCNSAPETKKSKEISALLRINEGGIS